MQQDDKRGGAASPGKAWSGRFAEPLDALTQRFNASVDFDRRLAEFDIQGSIAHARMLARCALISAAGPGRHRARHGADPAPRSAPARFPWTIEREDVHFNIEHRLTELVGDAGKRLHTARSRNDQVATDIRLWLREEIDDAHGAAARRARGAARPGRRSTPTS